MRHITIALPETLFAELITAAAEAKELCFGPAQFAAECIMSELASRRLPRVRVPITAAEAFGRKPLQYPEDPDE